MTYWDMVLKEVLNKDVPNQVFTFTNIGELKKKNLEANKLVSRRKEVKIYRLGARYKNIYFTRREAECMVWLLKGKTIRRVAMELGLSPRTVEFYLKNMKAKLNCQTKFELVELILESEFLSSVDFV
jgi:DNA-binding CsgD family transcriptional regulator